MPLVLEFLVHFKYLNPTSSFLESSQSTNPPPFLFSPPLILSTTQFILYSVDDFIKGLVGFESLKTNILFVLNGDPLWKVTFQDIIYFSLHLACFLRRVFSSFPPPPPPFTIPAEKNHPEMSPLPPTCSFEIYTHLAFQIKPIFPLPCKARLLWRIL